jgi:hypothetical protein
VSTELATRGKRVRRGLLAATFVVLAAASVGLFLLSRRADENAAVAHRRLVEAYQEQGREHLLGGDALRSLAYVSAALELGADNPALRFLAARGLEQLARGRATQTHETFVTSVDFSSDGTRGLSATFGGEAQWRRSRSAQTCSSRPVGKVVPRSGTERAACFAPTWHTKDGCHGSRSMRMRTVS